MKVIIYRFESEFAVVELPDKSIVNLPAVFVPGAREGDVIDIKIDRAATGKREERIKKLMNDVWADK